MSKIFFLKVIFFSLMIFLSSCQTVTNKIDEKTMIEEKELNKWLNKTESELKIVYGLPNKIEHLENRNKNLIYISKKFKIKCERKFEVDPKSIIVGFRSKNCF